MTDFIFEKILVAVDFSQHSNVALDQAILMATHSKNTEIVLLWVDTEQHYYEASGIDLDSIATEGGTPPRSGEDTRAKLDGLTDRVKNHGVPVSTRIESGYAADVIAEVALDVGAALVVVGTRGLTGFKRFLLGSVAQKVVRMCQCNVLVAREHSSEFSRILVATDFSPASEHALQVALALAKPGAHIDMLHAWQFPPGVRGASTPEPPSGPLADLRNEIVHRIDKLGAAMVARYADESRTLEFQSSFGAPAATIHERLESNMYDLVAMGTHGHRGFRRFLLGSVAEATVRHAPCSVLVTHDARQAID